MFRPTRRQHKQDVTETPNMTKPVTKISSNSIISNTTTKPQKYGKYTKNRLWYQMTTTLRWTNRPHRMLPHGLSGIVTLLTGYFLTLCSICGILAPFGVGHYKHYFMLYGIKYWIYIFGFATFLNAGSGLMLAPSATKMAQPIFRKIAWIQICLIYYTFRFLPEMYMLFAEQDADDSNDEGNQWKQLYSKRAIVRYMDIICFSIMTISTLGFGKDSLDYFQESKSISIAFLCSMFGIATLCVYPGHLVYDENWFTCIVSQYPIQGVAMTSYVYVPAATMIAFLSFVGTLNLRKMINNTETSILMIVCVFGILFIDVIAMEYWITDVSTQKLLLPCYHDSNDIRSTSYEYWEDFFDLSRRTKSLILWLTGKEVPPPIHSQL
jgi:hypothetical protein